jgi:hypothetical protein
MLGEDQQQQQQDERREHHPQGHLRQRGDRVIGEHEEKEQQGERDNQDSCRDTLGQRQHGAQACPEHGQRRLRDPGDEPPLDPMHAVVIV